MSGHVSLEKQQKLAKRMAALSLKEGECEEHFISGASKGGQKANKASSGVLLKHVPTQIFIKEYSSRYREINRYKARVRLCDQYESQVLGRKTASDLKAEKIRKQKKRRIRRRSEDSH